MTTSGDAAHSTLLEWNGFDREPLEATLHDEVNFESVSAQQEMLQMCRYITNDDSPLHSESEPLCLYLGLEQWVTGNRSAICDASGA